MRVSFTDVIRFESLRVQMDTMFAGVSEGLEECSHVVFSGGRG